MCITTSRRLISNRRPLDPATLNQVGLKTEYRVVNLQNGEQKSIPSQKTSKASSTKQKHDHIIVQHNYHDHANDNRADYQEEMPARGGVTTPFPLKLHEMLDAIAVDGYEHIISWQPHGRCFVIHKPKEFVDLLPRYFKLSKLASFQRQLNLYGFQRLTRGRDRGGYYHELFLRNKVFLAHSIQRIKVKGTGVRARSNPEQEPDFWSMQWVAGTTQQQQATVISMPQTTVSAAEPAMPLPCAPQLAPLSVLPIASVPSSSSNTIQEPHEDDVICAFGNKTFHYLDPFTSDSIPPAPVSSSFWEAPAISTEPEGDELFEEEAEAFFQDFEFPSDIGTQIDSDAVLGDLLDQMIA